MRPYCSAGMVIVEQHRGGIGRAAGAADRVHAVAALGGREQAEHALAPKKLVAVERRRAARGRAAASRASTARALTGRRRGSWLTGRRRARASRRHLRRGRRLAAASGRRHAELERPHRALHPIELFLGVPLRGRRPVRRHVRRRRRDDPLALQLAAGVVRSQVGLGRFGHHQDVTAHGSVRAWRPRGRRAGDRERLGRDRRQIELVVRPAAREAVVGGGRIRSGPRLERDVLETPFLHLGHGPLAGLLDAG